MLWKSQNNEKDAKVFKIPRSFRADKAKQEQSSWQRKRHIYNNLYVVNKKYNINLQLIVSSLQNISLLQFVAEYIQYCF